MTSSKSQSAARSASSPSETLSPFFMNSAHGSVPGWRSDPIMITVLRCGNARDTSSPGFESLSSGTIWLIICAYSELLKRGMRISVCTSAFLSPYSSSCVLYAGFTVTRIAPTSAVENCAIAHSGWFVAHTATRSPLRTPSAMKLFAAARHISWNSRYVYRTPVGR